MLKLIAPFHLAKISFDSFPILRSNIILNLTSEQAKIFKKFLSVFSFFLFFLYKLCMFLVEPTETTLFFRIFVSSAYPLDINPVEMVQKNFQEVLSLGNPVRKVAFYLTTNILEACLKYIEN
jgi:hypothetical protein